MHVFSSSNSSHTTLTEGSLPVLLHRYFLFWNVFLRPFVIRTVFDSFFFYMGASIYLWIKLFYSRNFGFELCLFPLRVRPWINIRSDLRIIMFFFWQLYVIYELTVIDLLMLRKKSRNCQNKWPNSKKGFQVKTYKTPTVYTSSTRPNCIQVILCSDRVVQLWVRDVIVKCLLH